MNAMVTTHTPTQATHSSAFENTLSPEVLHERVSAVFAAGAHERTTPSYTFISKCG